MQLTKLDDLYDAGLPALDEEQRKTIDHADQRAIINGDTPTVTYGWPVAAGDGSREARPREGKLRPTHEEANPILGDTKTMNLLDHPLISERYFFPRADALDEPFRVETNGIELLCHRTTGNPMLVHFHGNGEVVSDWAPVLSRALSTHGIGSLFGEYRGYGGSGGSPALVSMLDDALAVVDAAGVPPDRIVLYGRSVGSIYALHAAAHRRVAGLIIESGIADVGEGLGVRPDEIGATHAELDVAVSTYFDHRSKLRAFGGPVLIFHTATDHLVSVWHAHQLAEWAGPRATLHVFEHGGHNTIFARHGPALVEGIIAFVRTCTGSG